MTFSSLATMSHRIPDVGRSQPRDARVAGVLIHHNAGVDAYGQATAPSREVSAQYWITNAGELLPNVDENRRAFTSGMVGYPAGAQADHRFITVEVSNSPEGARTGSWAISAAAQNMLERLIADVHQRYRLGPVKRGTQTGVAVHQDFVPTACPGPYIMGRLGSIIQAAEAYRAGGIPNNEEDDMTPEQAKQLNSIFNAVFRGGNSMKDDKKSISQSLADLNTPVLRGGQRIPVRQDNADTNTMVRKVLSELEKVNERLDKLEK